MNVTDFETKIPFDDYTNFSENEKDLKIIFKESFSTYQEEKEVLDFTNQPILHMCTHRFYGVKEVKSIQNSLKEASVKHCLYKESETRWGSFVINAVETKRFFDQITVLQEQNKELFFRTNSLFETITALAAKQFCTESDAEGWKKSIRNRVSVEEYEQRAMTSLKIEETMCLTLALYYRQKNDFDQSINILRYLSLVKPLSQYLNAKKFFHGIQKVEKVYLFHKNNEEIQQLLSQSPTLKKLTLWTYTEQCFQTAKNITRFLQESSSLTVLSIRREYQDCSPVPGLITALEEGLRVNKSIEELDLSKLRSTNNETITLLKAIQANQKSKIQIVHLPGIKDDEAEEALDELLMALPQIRFTEFMW